MLRSKVSSNNNFKIRFGVVGTNFITDWLIADARQDERFELVAVYSRTQERLMHLPLNTNNSYLYFYRSNGTK